MFQEKKSKNSEFEVLQNFLLECGDGFCCLSRLTTSIIALGTYSQNIIIFNDRTGKLLSIIKEHKNFVTGIVVINSTEFISASWDSTLKVFKLKKKTKNSIDNHPKNVGLSYFDKEWNKIYMYECIYSLPGIDLSGSDYNQQINCLLKIPGKSIVVFGQSDTFRKWNYETKKKPFVIEKFESYDDFINSLCIISNEQFASGSNKLIIWNSKNFQKIKSITVGTSIYSMKYVDREKCIFLSSNSLISKYHSVSGNLILKNLSAHSCNIDALVVCEKYLISGSTDNKIRIWDFKLNLIKEIVLNDGVTVLGLTFDKNLICGCFNVCEISVFGTRKFFLGGDSIEKFYSNLSNKLNNSTYSDIIITLK